MIDFRLATPGDAERAVALWYESGASMRGTDNVDQVREVTRNPAAALLLALDRDRIVGSLLGTFDGWRGNMYRLVVHPDRRRQGIGREMVRRMESVFADWGVRRVTVLVETDRPWAAAFWTAVGYPRDERVVRHVGVVNAPRDGPAPA
jgi:GNAT superfamily N-acetyltransferase